MDDKDIVEESWDKKKIILALSLLFIIGGGAYAARGYYNLPTIPQEQKPVGQVAGVQTNQTETNGQNNDQPKVSIPNRQAIEQQLEVVKKEISTMNVTEIASSSPQVQKVLSDIQALGQYPGNQARELCQKVCSNL